MRSGLTCEYYILFSPTRVLYYTSVEIPVKHSRYITSTVNHFPFLDVVLFFLVVLMREGLIGRYVALQWRILSHIIVLFHRPRVFTPSFQIFSKICFCI